MADDVWCCRRCYALSRGMSPLLPGEPEPVVEFREDRPSRPAKPTCESCSDTRDAGPAELVGDRVLCPACAQDGA